MDKKVAKKNDVASFRNIKTKGVLAKEKQAIEKEASSTKMGRPAKPKAQKETFKLTLSITEEEGAKLAEKAGITPLAAYAKHYIRSETDLLK